MACPKEIKEILKGIPKEHHKGIQKIIKFYYKEGVNDIKCLIGQIEDIPPNEVRDYGVWHDSEIDGG